MELQEQVTSVQVSNKLKDLDIQAPSIFFREWRGAKEDEIEKQERSEYYLDGVNCYTVAELGKLLPLEITAEVLNQRFPFKKQKFDDDDEAYEHEEKLLDDCTPSFRRYTRLKFTAMVSRIRSGSQAKWSPIIS
jgi:hypothetical protein